MCAFEYKGEKSSDAYGPILNRRNFDLHPIGVCCYPLINWIVFRLLSCQHRIVCGCGCPIVCVCRCRVNHVIVIYKWTVTDASHFNFVRFFPSVCVCCPQLTFFFFFSSTLPFEPHENLWISYRSVCHVDSAHRLSSYNPLIIYTSINLDVTMAHGRIYIGLLVCKIGCRLAMNLVPTHNWIGFRRMPFDFYARSLWDELYDMYTIHTQRDFGISGIHAKNKIHCQLLLLTLDYIVWTEYEMRQR